MKHKRILAAALSAMMLVSLLPAAASANEGTTTKDTAYKDLNPRTEIYMVSDTKSWDYPYYGAKNEPTSGVLYGRTDLGGTLPGSTRYGMVNAEENANESVLGHYYGSNSWNGSYSLEYWSYLYGPTLKQGNHAFLVYLNFDNEGNDCGPIVSGVYDDALIRDFTYLNSMDFPVFLRIGGEVNTWTTPAAPKDFIAAYQHIAKLAQTYAPNAALVFSPNFSSAHLVDMDTFYPGDAYVDWVGCSLYYNKYHSNPNVKDAFGGTGIYGDALLNVQQTVNLAALHKKPIIATEGGSSNKFNGQDISNEAAERMSKAYAYLPMVYPQIKAIVASDYGMSWEKTDYTFYNNSVVTAAYRKAIANSAVYLDDYSGSRPYYTKLSAAKTNWQGTVELAAYSYAANKLSCGWYVDGKLMKTATEYPFTYRLDTSTLAGGTHTVTAKFSNGATKSYSFGVQTKTAMPTDDVLTVNGKVQTPTIYKIDDSNFFKIRDIAALLSGSSRQFEVGYDEKTGVTITSGKPYTMTGTELTGSATGGNRMAAASDDRLYYNGAPLALTVYKINDSNYFKLRDLGQALDFYVGYDPNTGVTISGDKGYEK